MASFNTLQILTDTTVQQLQRIGASDNQIANESITVSNTHQIINSILHSNQNAYNNFLISMEKASQNQSQKDDSSARNRTVVHGYAKRTVAKKGGHL